MAYQGCVESPPFAINFLLVDQPLGGTADKAVRCNNTGWRVGAGDEHRVSAQQLPSISFSVRTERSAIIKTLSPEPAISTTLPHNHLISLPPLHDASYPPAKEVSGRLPG